MSSVASTFSYRFQTAGSCFGPSLTELARKACRRARSYWNSISRRTTRSSFGIRWSAAVAAVDVAAQAEAEAGVAGRRAVELRLDRQLKAGAVRDHAAPCLLDGRARRREARLRRPVGVVEARLPAVEVGLVDRVEEEDAAHVRLAEDERERLGVVRALRGRVDGLRGRRLAAGVEARLRRRDLRLDAVLVVDDRQRRAGLRGAVEGGAEERDELAVVAEPDRRRARVLEVRRLARVV